jgi:stearoyl-CoA desaturase (Delta-9 desaturase)
MSDTDAAIAPAGRGKAPLVFSSRGFHRLQLRHFVLFDLLPLVGTIVALALVRDMPPDAADIVTFALLWLATGLGLTVGFHRYFSHRSFSTAEPVAALLLILGSMAARGPMISWVAMHRRHHQTSDRDGDLHSPNGHGPGIRGRLRGFAHAHFIWMMRHDYPNITHYVPDLLRDKTIVRFNRRYYLWVAIGLVLPTLIGGLYTLSFAGAATGFLWGGAVRLLVVEHTMSAINSLCHLVGAKRFPSRDDNSRNNSWLGLPSWGEAYHNNHHAFPNSAAFGLKWYEMDPGFWFIRGLQALGLAWDVKRPSPAAIAQRAGTTDSM